MPNNSVILSGAGGNNLYPLQGQVIQNLNGYPPSYDHTGAPTTSHTVSSTVIGTATSTTVTLVGKSAFSNANYFLSVTDETSHTTATITHKAPTYFVFSSTAEHTYTYFASGT